MLLVREDLPWNWDIFCCGKLQIKAADSKLESTLDLGLQLGDQVAAVGREIFHHKRSCLRSTCPGNI